MVNPNGNGRVVVIGDSQGGMYGDLLASLAKKEDFRLNILSVDAGNELPGETDTLWPSVDAFLGQNPVDVVVLAEAWTIKLGPDGKRRFSDAIDSIGQRANKIIVLLQPPIPPENATRPAIAAGARPPFYEDSTNSDARELVFKSIASLESDRVRVVDVSELLRDSDGSVRVIAPDGKLAYHDSTHLSDSGTALTREKLRDSIMAELAKIPLTRPSAAPFRRRNTR